MKNANLAIVGIVVSIAVLLTACRSTQTAATEAPKPLSVLFDTDANNELDDQHAMIYLLFNEDHFRVAGITTNATKSGGQIAKHTAEAQRILRLAKKEEVTLLSGANGNFAAIRPTLAKETFDGQPAVDFIIQESRKATRKNPLVLLPVGKLTNIALAIAKAPDIKDKVRIVWLGSNYPKAGEYNLDNDIPSLSYLLTQDVPFEMVLVRYQDKTASQGVEITQSEINRRMPGLGPHIDPPITGRHGATFHNFGDYSVNLFKYIDYHSPEKNRALYDAVAVAILKNPNWGQQSTIPAPRYTAEGWIDQPNNERQIIIWENFDREAIIEDFFQVLHRHTNDKK
ncbi:MAG: nucleoside hydrolase [Bacteroidota bacterium]